MQTTKTHVQRPERSRTADLSDESIPIGQVIAQLTEQLNHETEVIAQMMQRHQNLRHALRKAQEKCLADIRRTETHQ